MPLLDELLDDALVGVALMKLPSLCWFYALSNPRFVTIVFFLRPCNLLFVSCELCDNFLLVFGKCLVLLE